MATTKDSVDHKENILYLGYRDSAWNHTVVGLRVEEPKVNKCTPVEQLKVLEEEVPKEQIRAIDSLRHHGIQDLLGALSEFLQSQ